MIQDGNPAQFEYLRLLTARRSYYEARLKYLNSLVELRKSEVPIDDGLLLTGAPSAVSDSILDDALRDAAMMEQ